MPLFDFECPDDNCKGFEKDIYIEIRKASEETSFPFCLTCGRRMHKVVTAPALASSTPGKIMDRNARERWDRSEQLKGSTTEQATEIRRKRADQRADQLGKKSTFNPDTQDFSWNE